MPLSLSLQAVPEFPRQSDDAIPSSCAKLLILLIKSQNSGRARIPWRYPQSRALGDPGTLAPTVVNPRETTDSSPPSQRADISLSRTSGGILLLGFSGNWLLGSELPSLDSLRDRLGTDTTVKRVGFDTQLLGQWDSALISFLLKLIRACEEQGVALDQGGLPDGARKLLHLATAVPPKKDARKEGKPSPLLARLGKSALQALQSGREMLTFLGEATLAFGRLLRGRAQYRKVDLALVIQETGPQALPIVTLISFLVGIIMAFVGAVQLQQFGAQIYVANLVGLAMTREMGAMMAGIIMAGRTGAAFAAQLGTMQVNEEIDAFKTFGFSPMEFLVLPRMLALMLMMPLLTLYADLIGILGGALIGVGMLELGVIEYFKQTELALSLTHIAVGLIKGTIFGALVAVAGCMRGMQSGRSSAAVGLAATSAVVTAIVWIIVFDAILTVIFDVLGI